MIEDLGSDLYFSFLYCLEFYKPDIVKILFNLQRP
jgi:hypothetical protein